MTHGNRYAEVARALGGRVLAVDAIRAADENGLDAERLLRAIADRAELTDPSG